MQESALWRYGDNSNREHLADPYLDKFVLIRLRSRAPAGISDDKVYWLSELPGETALRKALETPQDEVWTKWAPPTQNQVAKLKDYHSWWQQMKLVRDRRDAEKDRTGPRRVNH